DLGIARDNLDSITVVLKRGLSEADVVLISAGTSVGERDLVPEVIGALGKPGLVVHGVRMRPAYPTGLAVVDGKPMVSLPGYPLSAVIAFNVFVRPLLLKMMNASEETPPRVKTRLLHDVTARPGYRTFARVFVRRTTGGYEAELIKTSGAGILSSLIRANAWLVIPEDRGGYSAGEEVEVTLIRPME
ncbi:MAG: molybdopterin-binding protein, partial [Candidatus Bathyarchaeia archaeon]